MKRNNIILIIPMVALTLTFVKCKTTSTPSCCVIAAPRINLTGEKTVVERQIVGDYKELEKDSWIVSSVKTTVQRTKGTGTLTAGDRELFMALKVREFHHDKIKSYKKKGYAGENFEGYLEYRKSGELEKKASVKKIVMQVIENENKARKQIFTRTLIKMNKKKPADKEISAFGRIFAQEQRALAQKNEWIQDKSGRWLKK